MKRNVVKRSHDLEGAQRLMNFWLSQDKDELEKVFDKENCLLKGSFYL